jgi:hypothetical protein
LSPVTIHKTTLLVISPWSGKEFMFRKYQVIGVLLMTIGAASAARAHDVHSPMFSFDGFGTLGVVHSSEDRADFSSSLFRPHGAGYTRQWSFDVDSRIGGQLTATLTPQLTAVLQVVAEQRHDNNYRPGVEWANLKYSPTPNFSLRVGRIALPGYLASGYHKVGYAHPWVRPPGDVYGLRPVSKSDGVDASYRFQVDELVSTLQIHAGREDVHFPAWSGSGTAVVRDAAGVSNTSVYGNFTGHAAYQRARLDIPGFQPMFDAFRQFGPEGIAIAERYGTENKPIEFASLGGSYDPGPWFLTGEWARIMSRSVVNDRSAWYIGGGFRLGRFTPYALYSQVKSESATTVAGVSHPGAADLNAALNAVLSGAAVQKTLSIGGRWDVFKNVAFKLQYEHIDIGAGSPGPLINTQPGFQPGGKVNVVSATVDFLF